MYSTYGDFLPYSIVIQFLKFSDELITAIRSDIAESDKQLSLPEYQHFRSHPFFSGKSEPQCNGALENGIFANGISNGYEDENLCNGTSESSGHCS